jgi:hypothetical protein
VIHVRVDRDGIAALARIGFLAHPRDGGAGSLFFEANFGIPQLEVFVERGRKKQNSLAFERHGRNLYLWPL